MNKVSTKVAIIPKSRPLALGLFVAHMALSSIAGAASLFPEDGSQKISKWYYSEKEIPYLYDSESEWQEVLEAFQDEGIRPISAQRGSFFQDLGFFDSAGKLVLQHIPRKTPGAKYDYSEYFGGFTQEVYMPWDWDHEEEVNLLTKADADQLGLESVQLKYGFIEGGATISGTFKNGDNYILLNEKSFSSIHKYYKDQVTSSISKKEVLALLEKDFNLKAGNFIVLEGSYSYHIDTYIKALPDGVLLFDSPDKKISILEGLKSKSSNPELDKYLEAEKENQNSYQYRVLRRTRAALDKRFKVIDVAGVFSRMKLINGFNRNVTDVNFFNGVSGTNSAGENFLITNKAAGAPELEEAWKQQLKNASVDFKRYHFVGRYKQNAGLGMNKI